MSVSIRVGYRCRLNDWLTYPNRHLSQYHINNFYHQISFKHEIWKVYKCPSPHTISAWSDSTLRYKELYYLRPNGSILFRPFKLSKMTCPGYTNFEYYFRQRHGTGSSLNLTHIFHVEVGDLNTYTPVLLCTDIWDNNNKTLTHFNSWSPLSLKCILCWRLQGQEHFWNM